MLQFGGFISQKNYYSQFPMFFSSSADKKNSIVWRKQILTRTISTYWDKWQKAAQSALYFELLSAALCKPNIYVDGIIVHWNSE